MNHHKAVKKLFDYFHNKVYKSGYRLDLDQGKQRKMVDNLIKLLANQIGLHSIGLNTFIDLFSYSFFYWSSKKTERVVTLNWIIGKKIVEKWLDKKEGTGYYIDIFLKEYNIDTNLLKQQLYEQDNEETTPALDPSEELEKERFEGEARLYNCMNHTTLYHHRSLMCLSCDNRSVCKRLLKNTSPRLYSRRGYVVDDSI